MKWDKEKWEQMISKKGFRTYTQYFLAEKFIGLYQFINDINV